jgi:transposase
MVHTMKDQTRGSSRSRRQHERAFKDELIAQSLIPGASVAAIAMKGGINANLLFKWRREHVRAMAVSAPTAATLLPVCVIPEATSPSTAQPIAPVGPAVNRGSSRA